MDVSSAFTEILLSRSLPLITDYELYLLLCRLYLKKEYKGVHLSLKRDFPDFQAFNRYTNILTSNGILNAQIGFNDVYRIRHIKRKLSPEEVLCHVDPFAYVSHLSAMEQYGLTDRSPKSLILTTPNPKLWKSLRLEKMDKDYRKLPIPEEERRPFQRITMPSSYLRRPISTTTTSILGDFIKNKESNVRITSIGQTFLDMLRKPKLCGGMSHVLRVWEDHAEIYLDDVIGSINKFETSNINKVRAGYIIEEVLGLQHPTVESWKDYASRGGSSKLDSSRDFEPTYSETWCLSLNCPSE